MRLKKVLTLALIAACGMGLASCTAESKKTEQVMTQEKATRMLTSTKTESLTRKLLKKHSLTCLNFMACLTLR